MTLRRRQRIFRRSGFTLMELLMVLLILIALAGVLIPILTNMGTRAHSSSASTNIAEIAKAVQTHEAMYNERPDGFDSLIEDAGGSGVPTAIVGTEEAEVLGAGQLVFTDLSTAGGGARIADALNGAGVTITYLLDSDTLNETFEAYADEDGTAGPDPILIDGAGPSGFVATLDAIAIATLRLETISLTTTEGIQAYVAFGLGEFCTMVGKSIVEAPVHFPEEGSPIDQYSRYLLIYAIPAEGPARFATVAAAHDEGLAGLNAHLSEYYETQE